MRPALTLFLTLLLAATQAPAQPADPGAAQRQWAAAHKVVRVAVDPDLEPIDGLDVDGRQRGLSADYLKLIAARSGLEFRTVRLRDRAEAWRALREHRVDLLSAAAPGDDAAALRTTPYLQLSAAIYSRSGEPGFATLAQLAGHAVAVADAAPWPAAAGTRTALPKWQKAADIGAALGLLRDNRVDAYVGDPFTTSAALTRLKLADAIVLTGQTGIDTAYSFAVRSDWAPLQEIIDAALQSIGVDEDRALRERWLKNPAGAAGAETHAAAPQLAPSNIAAIDAAQQGLAKLRDLGDDERKRIDELLGQARSDETAADQLAAQWQALNQGAAGADAAAQKLEESLAQTDTGSLLAWRATLPDRADVAQLEALLATARDDLAAARSTTASLQAEIDRQASRPAQLREELAAAQSVLDASRAATSAVDDGNIATRAQDLRNLAAARLAATRIAVLQLENRSYEPRMRLLAAQLRDRQRAAGELNQRVAILENLVLDRAGAAVADLHKRVERERDEAVAQFRSLGDTAAANVALVDKLGASMRSFNDLRRQRQDWDKWLRDTTQALKNTEERIRIGGVSEAVGLILLAEKARLKPLPLLRRSLGRLQTDLAQTRIALIDMREQAESLGDIGEAVSQALARLPDPPPERLNDLRTRMFRLLSTRSEVLPSLVLQQTRLAAADGDAEQVLANLVATTEKLQGILDSRLLWTPSHVPIDAAWFGRIADDGARFFNPRRWLRVGASLGAELAERPLISAAALAIVLVLFLTRRRVPARLERITRPMRRIRTDAYRLTGATLGWTVVAALPYPLLLAVLGWFCSQQQSGNGNLTEEVGYALQRLVATAGVLAFLRAMTLENGLAQFHFRWTRPRREALRDAVPWLALCALPAQFILQLIALRADTAPIDTIGRLVLTLALLGGAAIFWRLLAPGRVWTTRNAALVEPLRLRQAVRVAAAGIGLVLALLVLRGYYVTGLTVGARLMISAGVLLGIATLHGMAVRWLVLGERRLALKRMEKKQEAADEQRERSEGEALPEPEPEEITLASVSEQTRNFLRTLTILALLALLLWVWSDVTPAVTLLDTVPVWKSQNVSLLGVLEAVVVLALTWVATRNLPGLIEVGFLRRLHMDAATRYAVTSITRYVLVFAGTIIGLSLLGLHWSNLQWLAAGFSVGLGFGMQEIFANFISGLMVLFERPIRVGDVVTIGTVEGTVTRIRTRATTIVDWDNKEVIVPNKSFITDRLINWTLSDSVTRLVIKVGIGYGSDARVAQRLLLDAAAAHAQVLAEPAPTCWMTGFGDSTQDLELRVYVAEIAQRNPVRTELQMQIAEAFRANGIELAFPQMDVWMRNEVRLTAMPDAVACPPGGADRH